MITENGYGSQGEPETLEDTKRVNALKVNPYLFNSKHITIYIKTLIYNQYIE